MTALIILTASLIILLIFSYIQDYDNLITGSIIALVILAIFGWGLFAVSATRNIKQEKAIVLEIIRGKHIVVVTTLCDNCESDTKERSSSFIFKNNEVDVITDSTSFYWEKEYNYYGYWEYKTLKFKIDKK